MNVFLKNTTNGWLEEEFQTYIKGMLDLTKILITGCCTDICVRNLAISMEQFFHTMNRKVEVVVVENMVDTFDSLVHPKNQKNKESIEEMKHHGVKVKRLERRNEYEG